MTKRKKKLLQRDIFTEIIPELLELFREKQINATDEQLASIADKVAEMGGYKPRVAIFGKTGSGKSSLCNAVFDDEVAEVSDIEACTRDPQEYLLRFSEDKSIVLLDVPGVGESPERDKRYVRLYETLLPNVDLLLWVLKADDRALTIDLHAWKDLVRPYHKKGSPVLIVLNQVDRINPVRGWDTEQNCPGPEQAEVLSGRIEVVAREFAVPSDLIVPVSAAEGYGISALVEQVVHRLPKDKKLPFLKAVREERQTPEAIEEAEKGFIEAVTEWAQAAFKTVKPYIPTIMEVLRIIFAR